MLDRVVALEGLVEVREGRLEIVLVGGVKDTLKQRSG